LTAVLTVPVTLAVNCWLCKLERLTQAGLIATDIDGPRLIVALADLVESELRVAVTVRVCGLVILLGAVYRPLVEREPTAGLIVHVTGAFVVPVTLAVNCCVCELDRLAAAGLTDTDTGATRLTVALANLVESARLIAVTVKFWLALIAGGAV
jgi:hypothetical protein